MPGPLEAAMLFARLIPAIAANAVIIAGFFGQGWSPGTVLALYWLQTLIGIPLAAILIVLHRVKTRKLGYYRLARSPDDGKVIVTSSAILGSFLQSSIIFSLAHGVFLAVILSMMHKGPRAMDPADVKKGLVMLAVILLVTFLVDLVQLRSRPFAWVRQRVDSLMRRVLVMHFVIIFGMVAAAFMSNESAGFFGVFIVLKLVADVVAELPAPDPQDAPRWLAWIGRQSGKPDAEMNAEWKRIRAEQREGFVQAERTLDEVLAERAP